MWFFANLLVVVLVGVVVVLVVFLVVFEPGPPELGGLPLPGRVLDVLWLVVFHLGRRVGVLRVLHPPVAGSVGDVDVLVALGAQRVTGTVGLVLLSANRVDTSSQGLFETQ